jgi:penicillin-binding protein 1C
MKRRIILAVSMPATVLFMLIAGLLVPYDRVLPSFSEVRSGYRSSESWLLDRHGEVMSVRRIDFHKRRLEWIALEDISPATRNQLLSVEDRRFFEHAGVDWRALLGSMFSTLPHLFDGKRPRGASTLTMQLAGLLDPSLAPKYARRSLIQKWRQIRAARTIEQSWSKRDILEAYFNLASFRGESIGIQAASRTLFGISPSALNQPQSRILIALLQNPMANPQRIATRACAQLNSSASANSCAELRTLALESLSRGAIPIPQENIAPHLAQKLLNSPGVRVTSTLDADLQRYAIRSLREHLLGLDNRNVHDGAVVVLDNASGDVLAYVGSSGDLSQAGLVDGASALRQAGSTLKPFLYGLAIAERRLTAASIINDSPLQIDTQRGLYVPQNYDHDFKGPVSARTALASSLNVPAVHTLDIVGVDHFVHALRTYGFTSLTEDGNHYGLSLALGGADVRLIELANAYRMLANGGVWLPYGFLSGDRRSVGRRVLSREAAFVIGDILSDRGARALTFGLENPLATRAWTAVKTGTSKDMRDNWCIGFSDQYTVGVWVGNFGGGSMRDVSGISGAAPVWRDLMDFLHKNGGNAPKPPPSITTREVRFFPPVEAVRVEHFLAGTETNEIHLLASTETAFSGARILYPTEGTIIAIDPDIPVGHQRVILSSHGIPEITWMLDGEPLGQGSELSWQPTSGRHRIVINGSNGKEFDSINMEVRGGSTQGPHDHTENPQTRSIH